MIIRDIRNDMNGIYRKWDFSCVNFSCLRIKLLWKSVFQNFDRRFHMKFQWWSTLYKGFICWWKITHFMNFTTTCCNFESAWWNWVPVGNERAVLFNYSKSDGEIRVDDNRAIYLTIVSLMVLKLIKTTGTLLHHELWKLQHFVVRFIECVIL